MKWIIIFSFVVIGCSVIKEPRHTVDSTIVSIDTFHRQGDSIIFHKRKITVVHESRWVIKPMFWYLLTATIIVSFFVIKNNR